MKENNILIAKFLGWKEIVPNGWKFQATTPNYISVDVPDFDFRNIDVIDTFETAHDDMKFNSDWNWLMLIVKKCYEVEHNDNEYYEAIYYAVADLDITKTYNACVEFIKWYNDNK